MNINSLVTWRLHQAIWSLFSCLKNVTDKYPRVTGQALYLKLTYSWVVVKHGLCYHAYTKCTLARLTAQRPMTRKPNLLQCAYCSQPNSSHLTFWLYMQATRRLLGILLKSLRSDPPPFQFMASLLVLQAWFGNAIYVLGYVRTSPWFGDLESFCVPRHRFDDIVASGI